MNTVNAGGDLYDFICEENSPKWKGLLMTALKRVLEQVHPSLGAREEALEYVEQLCLRLLALLCAKPSPHTVQDVEYRVRNTFPTPIDKWALKEAQEALERGKKKSVLPVDKIHNLLQKELLLYKVDSGVSLFLVAVLEYISADILKLAGNYVKHFKNVEITFQDVQISMNADKALMDMFYQDEGGGSNSLSEGSALASPSTAPRTSLTYEEVVRELMASERQYLRELHMLIRVFREEIIKLTSDQRHLDVIFSNIMDIYELTVTLLGSLEDVMEMAQEQMPYIGSCFEELAEAAEFDVYKKYAKEVMSSTCRDTLNNLLSRPDVDNALSTAWHGMKLALKYYLPALLLGPIRHCFTYMDYIKLLRGLSGIDEDKETLIQVEGLLKPLQSELGRCMSHSKPRNTQMHARARRQAALHKIHELEKIVENWDSKDIGQCCNEFVREDVLMKVGSGGKRPTNRRVFLFDGLIILCKPNSRRQSTVHTSHPECKLKERFFIRKVEIIDHQDTEEYRNAFEISPRMQQPIILCAKSVEDKNSWMADLVMLNTRSMLERILDSILTDMERKHPLKLPSPDMYKFAEPDSRDNIILEQRENGGVPLIKGATIYKLVERLTYHIYADPKFVRTFLTTYRSFCAPAELLELLKERFNIPKPSLVYEQDPNDTDKMQKNSQREDWKRYRKEYCQPVQFRVLNVLRHWVDHHFYDFERDQALLDSLHAFLNSVDGKSMRKWVDSVLKILQRKKPDAQRMIKFAFDDQPPPIEWHLTKNEDEFALLTLHPVELARQLTILEFDLYRTIKPSELVGSVWTKKNKDKTSPNLLKMIKHTTNITRWYEKNIVEAENFEERCAIVNRVIEIMTHLDELNNFNGVLAIASAMGSASVFRLRCTFQAITQNNRKVLEECRGADDHFKKYQEKLRSINPPCVPFLGMYLTNILHIEEGNPDFLPNTQLINFFKRRKVAEITGEIQQYQNQPYCYNVEPKIKHFLETLNPFGDMSDTDISNYLFNKSIEIEPRGCKQVPKFPRKWPQLSLKSPSTKAKQSRTSVTSTNTVFNTHPVPKIEEEVKKVPEEPAKNDSEFSVFAQVHIPTGQNSPTLSPASPATSTTSLMSWWQGHSRSPSVSSTTSAFRAQPIPLRPEPALPPTPHRYNPQHFTVTAPSSPGPHSPASPGPHALPEPHSPHVLSSTPPPLPPRRRRDSPEINSPQQVSPKVPHYGPHNLKIKQAPDAPQLPPRECSPPPLPPRREPGASPNAHHTLTFGSTGTSPRLHPTHTSQLHIRRHSNIHPHAPVRSLNQTYNGGTSLPPQPPSISPRLLSDSSSGQSTPKLPPKPAIRSAGLTTGTMFQYPSTTNT
ncbi:PREDICTED: protein son of sevenless isoform X2 [Nicrophorus vespilloides]|uniref:Protein son of sevenless isoform X2 n=1 Tax=Nicrophorus vespilloides TaxID=110193 RepID=A0ABM1MZU4_NICVS|nr:PREDICTED: protein son of sevenless isoform X2 [Nicrophorus vespilloides]